ncbi:MAG: 16S rRNA (cytosine(967)-C(5))-methyltransferase RsmB [Proteobacteria bacterium]|nr:16S rRNA (cytosine(967)-C(5))-methyltransferase RsmB [Pseudomonadota bacterium]
MSAAPELSAVFAAASRIVARVAAGESLAANPAAFGTDGPMRGATMDMVFGTLRRYGRGDALVDALANRGTPDPQIRALLLCALYAIESASYADHVAVDQGVKACGVMNKPAAKGFVNALLRRFLRERGALDARTAADPVAQNMHPQWWIDALRNAYPESWQAVLAQGNCRPPMGLRVNRRRASPDEYLARIEAAGMHARRVGESALVLERPVRVESLPGFAAGEVSVQDPGAQLAARYLDLSNGQHVLDACAAPGGKACHVLELAEVDLLALDSDASRCERVQQNLERLGLSARVQAADSARPDDWWDGRPFDRILADVPCTASGIVRRHPDIKWLRRPGDPARFAGGQARILEALWRVLAPDGKLLYVTCSVFPEENAAVVDAFCARHPEARRLGLPGNAPAQLVPDADHDGFFFALLQK